MPCSATLPTMLLPKRRRPHSAPIQLCDRRATPGTGWSLAPGTCGLVYCQRRTSSPSGDCLSAEKEHAMIEELASVVLTTTIPEHGLQAGDIGTVVMVHQAGRGYTVEFLTLSGDTV